MTSTRALAVSFVVFAACGKGHSDGTPSPKVAEGSASSTVTDRKVTEAPPKPTFVTCDAASITALSTDLDKANCLGVDLSNKALTDACKATAQRITGKTYALEGCTFASQGNDIVSFGAAGTDKTVECMVRGGEAGVNDFREAAMKLDTDKLRLDVSGVIAKAGMTGIERLRMTDCQITAHE
ncbi:MAG TPA: hypothetical protein VLT45_13030 [Kofleriaceae bacterium]|nr:hypothetical protein [Kofleriaceae bacterium]